METAVDVTGGTSYTEMGTSQLMSVPYALHANMAENVINDQVDDADADPTNEMNTGVVLNGTVLEVTDGNGTITTDLSTLQDGTGTDDQNITGSGLFGTTLTIGIEGGTSETVDLSPLQDVYTAGTGIDITGNVISTTSVCGLSIGDTYQGGIIFYLDASGCHGLISAPTDQSTGIQWYNATYTVTNAVRDGIVAGEFNTERIIANQGPGIYAAQICANYQGGNYGDWYLPCSYELNLMYQNIGQGDALGLGNIGGFADSGYWISAESDINYTWRREFGAGFQGLTTKNNSYYVRASRAF